MTYAFRKCPASKKQMSALCYLGHCGQTHLWGKQQWYTSRILLAKSCTARALTEDSMGEKYYWGFLFCLFKILAQLQFQVFLMKWKTTVTAVKKKKSWIPRIWIQLVRRICNNCMSSSCLWNCIVQRSTPVGAPHFSPSQAQEIISAAAVQLHLFHSVPGTLS